MGGMLSAAGASSPDGLGIALLGLYAGCSSFVSYQRSGLQPFPSSSTHSQHFRGSILFVSRTVHE